MTPVTLPVWRNVTPALQAELASFWLEHGALADCAAAEQRALQAVAIARDGDGRLWGVSTATVRLLPRLRQPVYYYRQFFAPTHRGQGAARAFTLQARAVLERHNASLPAPEAIGVLLEFENRALAAQFPHSIEDGFAFIGFSPQGHPLRLSYFEGVRLLPAPAPAPIH